MPTFPTALPAGWVKRNMPIFPANDKQREPMHVWILHQNTL